MPPEEEMVTVTISVQGSPVFTRSAMRIRNGDRDTYVVDTGKRIRHRNEEGLVSLTRKMLGTIQEPQEKPVVEDTRTYYATREEAEQIKQPGDRIYTSAEKGFWITTPKRKVAGRRSKKRDEST
jgi:hypothetical protein